MCDMHEHKALTCGVSTTTSTLTPSWQNPCIPTTATNDINQERSKHRENELNAAWTSCLMENSDTYKEGNHAIHHIPPWLALIIGHSVHTDCPCFARDFLLLSSQITIHLTNHFPLSILFMPQNGWKNQGNTTSSTKNSRKSYVYTMPVLRYQNKIGEEM